LNFRLTHKKGEKNESTRQLKSSVIIRVIVVITYVGMVSVNALANLLPINGINTGQVSDSYPNLFAPAGLTFAIWGLIYLLLAGYSVYQLGVFQKNKKNIKSNLLNKVGILLSISSIANMIWIFSWHYLVIPLSMLLMLVILICLILIMKLINNEESLTSAEKTFMRMPFSIYFGWITVATIANATTLLVSIHWDGFGITEQTWTVLILIIGVLIGALTTIKNRDIAYGLVIIWAYTGILIKHLSKDGFAFQYPSVVNTVVSCIVLLIITLAYVLIKAKQIKNIAK
ncbi:MAG TPA: tryptophan-rich sensory protein, partial [Clostridiales bacterium]|nr:tryptophan-rich sensory protein [Clostridiales bacterium]